jgi:hypothetical protein
MGNLVKRPQASGWSGRRPIVPDPIGHLTHGENFLASQPLTRLQVQEFGATDCLRSLVSSRNATNYLPPNTLRSPSCEDEELSRLTLVMCSTSPPCNGGPFGDPLRWHE